MTRLWKRTKRSWLTLALAVVVSSALVVPAWAAPKKKGEEQAVEQSYLLPYILTIVAIGMGVAVVCFPSQRKNEWEPKKD